MERKTHCQDGAGNGWLVRSSGIGVSTETEGESPGHGPVRRPILRRCHSCEDALGNLLAQISLELCPVRLQIGRSGLHTDKLDRPFVVPSLTVGFSGSRVDPAHELSGRSLSPNEKRTEDRKRARLWQGNSRASDRRSG